MPTPNERESGPAIKPGNPPVHEDRSQFLSEYRRLLKAVRSDHSDTTRHLDLAKFLIDNRYYDRAHSPLRAARALQPRRLETQYLLAALYANQSNFQQAQLTYREILEINPGEALAHFHLGTSLLGLSRPEEALPVLVRAIELDPKQTGAYWHLGELSMRNGDYPSALRYYQTLKTLEPNSDELFFRLGEVQRLRGLSDRAAAAYQRSLEIRPTHVKARLALARLYLDGELPSKAQEILEEVMEWDDRPAEAFILLAHAYKEQAESSLALATLLKMANLFPEDPRSHRELAMAYFLEGEIVLAEEEYLNALNVAPNDKEIVIELGALYVNSGTPGKAITIYEKSLENFPNDPRIFGLLAEVYDRFDRPEDGLHACNRAIESDRGNEALLLMRANFNIRLGKYDEALSDFAEVRLTNPDSAEARLDADLIRGHQKYREAFDLHTRAMDSLSQGNDGQALTQFKGVVQMVPDKVDWLKDTLDLCLKIGRFDEALSTFVQLEALAPDDFSIHLRHADLCYRLHNYDQARQLYARAVELDTDNLAARIGVIRCLRHKMVNRSLDQDRFESLEEEYLGSRPSPMNENARLIESAYLQLTLGYLIRHGTTWADKAIECFDSIGGQESEDVSRYKLLGRYETFRKLQDDSRALTVLEELIRRFPHETSFALSYLDHLVVAGAFERASRFTDGMTQKYPRLGLIRAKALVAYARWAEKSGNPKAMAREKIDQLRQNVANDPRDSTALFELGMGLYSLTRSTEWRETRKKTLIALNRARSLNPRSMWPWWGLIKTGFYQRGDEKLPAAEVARQAAQARSAIALFPREACFHYYLGRILHISSDPDDREQGTRSLVTATLFSPCFVAAEYSLAVHDQDQSSASDGTWTDLSNRNPTGPSLGPAGEAFTGNRTRRTNPQDSNRYRSEGPGTRSYHHYLRVLEATTGSRYQGLVQDRMRRLVP